MSEHISLTRIAELARLDLTADELSRFENQLSHVLEHIDTLNSVDVDGIEPSAHPCPVFDVLRPDESRPGLPPEALLQNAPDQAQGQVRVPKVVEGS